MCALVSGEIDLQALLTSIRDQLRAQGIDLDAGCCVGGPRVKVVCVAPDLKGPVEELGRSPRDQVVMVRVDVGTARDLDAWVQTGAVRSRSEAAALFIREGLRVRQSELERLREAINEVDKAQERLRERTRDVFGGNTPDEPSPRTGSLR